MKKQIAKYVLHILLLSFFTFSYSQKSEIDSLFNTIKGINSIEDFKKFESFQDKYYKLDIKNTPKNEQDYFNVYNNALKWAKKQHDNKLFLKAKFYVLRFYRKKGDFKSFLNIANELIKNEDFKEMKEIVNVLDLMMFYYKETEQFSELIELYPLLYEQIKKHKISLYRLEESIKNREMGDVFYMLKDYDKSRFYYKKSILADYKNKQYLNISSIQNNIGLTFLNQLKLDSAKYYFKKALSILRKKTDTSKTEIANFIPVLKANMAVVWTKEEKFNKALPIFLEELNSTKNMKDNVGLRGSYINLAKFFLNKGDISKSIKYLDSTETLLKLNPNTRVWLKYYNIKAKCLLVKGEISKANNLFEKIRLYKDSIQYKKLKQQQILASIKYEFQKKDKELSLSKQKLKLQSKTNTYQKLALIVSVLLIAGLFLFSQKNLKDKKHIIKQKLKTQKALEEKDILLKEVHHRVKNNLQIITSILDLQNAKINDAKLNEILEQGQNRIQSMAIIHQQLYEEDNMKDVDIQKYLDSLINHIAISNNNPNVIFKIKTNKLRFNVTTAIPLGLIINELITNIFKHAFNKFEKGKVSINITKIEEHYFKLVVKDSGKGFPKNFNIEQSTSLGLKLVKILTNQLKGTFTVDNNATFTIKFRDDVAV